MKNYTNISYPQTGPVPRPRNHYADNFQLVSLTLQGQSFGYIAPSGRIKFHMVGCAFTDSSVALGEVVVQFGDAVIVPFSAFFTCLLGYHFPAGVHTVSAWIKGPAYGIYTGVAGPVNPATAPFNSVVLSGCLPDVIWRDGVRMRITNDTQNCVLSAGFALIELFP